jgi:hypothetical protein
MRRAALLLVMVLFSQSAQAASIGNTFDAGAEGWTGSRTRPMWARAGTPVATCKTRSWVVVRYSLPPRRSTVT